MDHEIELDSHLYTPVDENQIPTGEISEVVNTPFDLRKRRLGELIDADHEQIRRGNGYDINFVLSRGRRPVGELSFAARVSEPQTGRILEVYTTEPGIQLYTANGLDGKYAKAVGGKSFNKRSAFCLEAQHFPDGPNIPHFPNTILYPGETLKSATVYKFSVQHAVER